MKNWFKEDFVRYFKKAEYERRDKLNELGYPKDLVEGHIPNLLFVKDPVEHVYNLANDEDLKANISRLWKFEDESRLLIETNNLHLIEMELMKFPDEKFLSEKLKKQWAIVNELTKTKGNIFSKVDTYTWQNVYNDLCEIFGSDLVDEYCTIYVGAEMFEKCGA